MADAIGTQIGREPESQSQPSLRFCFTLLHFTFVAQQTEEVW